MSRVLFGALLFSAVASPWSGHAGPTNRDHAPTLELNKGGTALPQPQIAKVVQRHDPPLQPAAEVEREIVSFVTGTYLILNRLSPYEIERFYGPYVDYFGRPRLPLIWVMKEKLRHYRRHPIRHYQLIPDSILISPLPGAPGAYDVIFDYSYQIGRRHWMEEGLGRAELTIDLNYRPVRIYREDGGALGIW